MAPAPLASRREVCSHQVVTVGGDSKPLMTFARELMSRITSLLQASNLDIQYTTTNSSKRDPHTSKHCRFDPFRSIPTQSATLLLGTIPTAGTVASMPGTGPMGSCHFVTIPNDIRLIFYDTIFAHHKQKAVPYGSHRSRPSNEQGPLALRLANRLIAEETFGYLFHTLNLTRLIGEARNGDVISQLRSVLEGRWSCIKRLVATGDDVIEHANRDFVSSLVPGAFRQAEVDGTALRSRFERLGWPSDQRKVHTLAFSHFYFVYKMGGLQDFLLYLGLLKAFFPLLKEVRLVFWGGDDFHQVYTTAGYRVVGREVREFGMDCCKWMMPQVAFTDPYQQ